MIAVEIKGAKELIQKFKKLEVKKPGMVICRELALRMVENMKSFSPVWRGGLQRSIQSRLTKEGYNIHMLSYGMEFETGHEIEPSPMGIGFPHPTHPLLTLWAINKFGGSWKRWLGKVFAEGYTVPPGGAFHMPFIQPAIDVVMDDFENIAKLGLVTVLRESGFNYR